MEKVYEFEDEITPAVISRAMDNYYQFTTAGFIMMFQVGYFLFEYGSVRKKNAETVLIKSIVILILSCFSTYSFGYAFAYGESYFIGVKYYFTSFSQEEAVDEKNEMKWILLTLTASMTA